MFISQYQMQLIPDASWSINNSFNAELESVRSKIIEAVQKGELECALYINELFIDDIEAMLIDKKYSVHGKEFNDSIKSYFVRIKWKPQQI